MNGIKYRIIDVVFKTSMVAVILGIYQKISSLLYYNFDFTEGLGNISKLFGSYFLGFAVLLGIAFSVSLVFLLIVSLISLLKETYLYITTGEFDFESSFELMVDVGFWYTELVELIDRITEKKSKDTE